MKENILFRAVVIFLFLFSVISSAWAGGLDTAFGTDGKFIIAFHDFSLLYRANGTKIFVQPGGRIVAGGSFTNNGPDGQTPGVALVGLTTNGSIDTAFGNVGVFKDWNPAASTGLQDAVIQPDGRIIRLSQFFPLFQMPSGRVIRSTVNGVDDFDFSANVNVGSSNTIPMAGGLLPSGKVIVTVFAQTGPDSFHIYRLNPDGSRDTSFGTNGAKQLTWMSRLPNPWINTLSVLPNGDVLLMGDLGNFSSNGYPEFFIARLNPDGNLDAMFGRQGLVRYRYGNGMLGFVSDMIVRTDGSCVLAGSVFNNDVDSFMIAFTRRGKFDATFGSSGVVVTDFASGALDSFSAITQDAGGKLIAVGEAPLSIGSPGRFLVSRFSSSGVLEAHTKTEFTPGQFAKANEVTIQPDGKILVIGSTYNPSTIISFSSMWAIARYTDITNDSAREYK